jgi:hypothetical protein
MPGLEVADKSWTSCEWLAIQTDGHISQLILPNVRDKGAPLEFLPGKSMSLSTKLAMPYSDVAPFYVSAKIHLTAGWRLLHGRQLWRPSPHRHQSQTVE